MDNNKRMILNLSNQVNQQLQKVLGFLCIISMGGLAIVMILNVVSRYFITYPLVWADEMVLYLFSWTSFLGAGLGVQKNNMASVRMLVDRFSDKILTFIDIFIQILIVVFGATLTYFSYIWWSSSSTFNATSATMGVPMWVPTIILPVSMAIITLFALTNIIKFYYHEEIGVDEFNLSN
ncbi:TRAP transporter small permease [Sporosarcina siberiensis]|uniref:TRAP transporter small permease n=1 Tax=Sporosarcina siberiensis TaxID=1365606 RepID=A0ABW4SJP6_9BACL